MTTNLAVQTYALTSGWLNETPTTGTTQASAHAFASNSIGQRLGQSVTTTAFHTGGWGWSPSYWYYYPTAERRPIKLGMSEVEKLRSAAKRDAKLKAILEKFTDQIEVVVDFK